MPVMCMIKTPGMPCHRVSIFLPAFRTQMKFSIQVSPLFHILSMICSSVFYVLVCHILPFQWGCFATAPSAIPSEIDSLVLYVAGSVPLAD